MFYEIYRHEHEHEGEAQRVSCHVHCHVHVYCIKHEEFSFYMYNIMYFYITATPYLPCNNNNINRKELYDFYYVAITFTTGYKIMLS